MELLDKFSGVRAMSGFTGPSLNFYVKKISFIGIKKIFAAYISSSTCTVLVAKASL